MFRDAPLSLPVKDRSPGDTPVADTPGAPAAAAAPEDVPGWERAADDEGMAMLSMLLMLGNPGTPPGAE